MRYGIRTRILRFLALCHDALTFRPNAHKLVPQMGLEPTDTTTSTLRVYQFHHRCIYSSRSSSSLDLRQFVLDFAFTTDPLYLEPQKDLNSGSELGIRTLVPLTQPSDFQSVPLGLSGNSLYLGTLGRIRTDTILLLRETPHTNWVTRA